MRIEIDINDARVEPVRRQVRIPRTDHMTQAWWNRQGDPSASVRLLILEEAKRNGLVDKVTHLISAPVTSPAPTAATHSGPTAVPNLSVAPAPVSNTTPQLDPRDLEIELLRAEVNVFRDAFGPGTPLFNVVDDDLSDAA